MTHPKISTIVRKRRVFYIPGYDPIHPRRYRELYRKEGAAQAQITGYEIDLTPKEASDIYGWHASGNIDGTRTTADVDVLVWSDIVRSSMSNSILATYYQLVRTAWTYVASGTLRRLMWMRKGPVIAALYPVGILLLQLLIALLVAGIVVRNGSNLLMPYLGTAGLAIAAVVGGCLAYGILRWCKRHDSKIFAYYLMHDFAYAARWNGGYGPHLENRMESFGELIAEALRDDVDEILVVGHSSGAHLAISIIADLIRANKIPANSPALSLLSLGQVVPMVSFLPKAQRLRADLAFLAACDAITWVDVTAPGDGCSFALCDPVAVSGVTPPNKRWPLVISAAFTQSLKPETWKALRWRFFRLHFQYLCAFDAPLDYDYFQITAGPLTLGDRYRDRKPAKSRIDVAASKYTSIG